MRRGEQICHLLPEAISKNIVVALKNLTDNNIFVHKILALISLMYTCNSISGFKWKIFYTVHTRLCTDNRWAHCQFFEGPKREMFVVVWRIFSSRQKYQNFLWKNYLRRQCIWYSCGKLLKRAQCWDYEARGILVNICWVWPMAGSRRCVSELSNIKGLRFEPTYFLTLYRIKLTS